MQRTRRNKASLILCSDLHLREDTPVCRTDNYQEKQWIKLNFISDLQKEHDCPVVCGGDLFDHWKPSPWLLRETILHIPDQFYTIYGQHDLPQHNLQLVNKCGINVLQAAKCLYILPGTHWGQEPNLERDSLISPAPNIWGSRKVLVWHKMNYQGKKPWPGCTDPMAAGLLRKYPQYDLILTGDNHKTFVEEYEGRILVNPGSMMRMDADQIDHHPCVFLWYADDNRVEKVILPHDPDVVSREHLETIQERDARIDAFISHLDGDWSASMSFEDNLEAFKQTNNVRESVMNIIYKSLDV